MTQKLLTYGTLVQDLPFGGNFSVNADTTIGLTFGFRAGVIVDGKTRTALAAGTLALTASVTNWICIQGTALVVNNGAAPSRGALLYKIVTDGSGITVITDLRGSIVTKETSF